MMYKQRYWRDTGVRFRQVIPTALAAVSTCAAAVALVAVGDGATGAVGLALTASLIAVLAVILVVILPDPFWHAAIAAAVAAATLALMLAGVFSFAPLFLPSFVLWAYVARRSAHRQPLVTPMALAAAALWGFGLTFVSMVLAL